MFLFQFTAYPVGRVELQNGTDEHQHHPVVVHIADEEQIVDGKDPYVIEKQEEGCDEKECIAQ